MLSTDDRHLVARDSAIPGLAVVLDDQAMADHVAHLLPGREVEACAVTYVRYKPAANCLVGFAARVDGATVVGQAKAHRRGDRDKAHKLEVHALDRHDVGHDEGDPGLPVETSDDLVTTTLWSMDRTLPAVARLVDRRRRERLLRRVLPRRLAGAVEDIVLLSYKPDRRLVVRLDGPDGPVAVLRCVGDSAYPHAVTGTSFAWCARVPGLLGHDARHGLLATQWLPADRRLADVAFDDRGLWTRFGHVVGRLHASHDDGLATTPPGARADRVLAAAEAVRAVHPHVAPLADEVAAATAAAIRSLPPRRVPLHGDLSPDQVLVDGDRMAVVDFDVARRGDPADDLGSVGASMVATALQAGDVPTGVDPAFAAVVAAHGHGVSERDVAVFVAAGLLARATEPFRHRWNHWPDAIEAMVQEAREWVPR